jgi:hypothetical protein
MTWQDWAVGIVVLLCVIEVIRRIVRFFRSAKNNDNPCANCTSDCDLKQLFDAKQQKCRTQQDKPNKKYYE